MKTEINTSVSMRAVDAATDHFESLIKDHPEHDRLVCEMLRADSRLMRSWKATEGQPWANDPGLVRAGEIRTIEDPAKLYETIFWARHKVKALPDTPERDAKLAWFDKFEEYMRYNDPNYPTRFLQTKPQPIPPELEGAHLA